MQFAPTVSFDSNIHIDVQSVGQNEQVTSTELQGKARVFCKVFSESQTSFLTKEEAQKTVTGLRLKTARIHKKNTRKRRNDQHFFDASKDLKVTPVMSSEGGGYQRSSEIMSQDKEAMAELYKSTKHVSMLKQVYPTSKKQKMKASQAFAKNKKVTQSLTVSEKLLRESDTARRDGEASHSLSTKKLRGSNVTPRMSNRSS